MSIDVASTILRFLFRYFCGDNTFVAPWQKARDLSSMGGWMTSQSLTCLWCQSGTIWHFFPLSGFSLAIHESRWEGTSSYLGLSSLHESVMLPPRLGAFLFFWNLHGKWYVECHFSISNWWCSYRFKPVYFRTKVTHQGCQQGNESAIHQSLCQNRHQSMQFSWLQMFNLFFFPGSTRGSMSVLSLPMNAPWSWMLLHFVQPLWKKFWIIWNVRYH